MCRSAAWLAAEARYCIESGVSKKQWNMIIAELSHAPSTKEGARAHKKYVDDINRTITEPVRLLNKRKRMRGPVISRSWVKLEPGEKMEDYK